MKIKILILLLFLFYKTIFLNKADNLSVKQTPIDREALVKRNNVSLQKFDSLNSLSVGNGEFAFTVDPTGLQTFPEFYDNGIPLGTQSQWGWHSFPNTENFRFEEILREYSAQGRQITYPYQFKEPERKKKATDYLRQNPHRLHLGRIGFEIKKQDGSTANLEDIKEIHQELNLWTGEIRSHFKVENIPVEVYTICHQKLDMISVKVSSDLLVQGRLKIVMKFPYANGNHVSTGCDWNSPKSHTTKLINKTSNSALLERILDLDKYWVQIAWKDNVTLSETGPHNYALNSPNKDLEFNCLFKENGENISIPSFSQTKVNSTTEWRNFWTKGGAIDFTGSTDPRANELERRIVLSQYLTKIQCAGSLPPQETGLTYNSWFGKYHLEMHWWHAAHFALWNRIDLLEKSMAWYFKVLNKAKATASRQGFKGARWQKMTDPRGEESPSSVGPFLIWQQPHLIYYSELCYRHYKDKKTLDKYKEIVFETAEFMASYAYFDEKRGNYILGKGLIPAQESFKPEETYNPTFELAYWHWALLIAQKWRERLNLPRNQKWDDVLKRLSPLPIKDGLYLFAESQPDCYDINRVDHPAVLCALGSLPSSKQMDTTIMNNTIDEVLRKWEWNTTWGWDFPVIAMTATRLNRPETAMDALLMNTPKNTYLLNGHNYQDERLRLYLPGNGGVLFAAVLMCAGYDNCNISNPGIPKNGKWQVKWEGLKSLP